MVGVAPAYDVGVTKTGTSLLFAGATVVKCSVVVVEAWALWCKTCMHVNLPHLARLHQRLAAKDLVVVTVALPGMDRPAGEVRDAVTGFLARSKLTFVNLLLDEPDELWQDKLHIERGLPHTFVFDRQGRWTLLDADELGRDPGRLDRLVEELLR